MIDYIYPCIYMSQYKGVAILHLDLGFHKWHLEYVDIGGLEGLVPGDVLLVKIEMKKMAKAYAYTGEILERVRKSDRADPEAARLLQGKTG